MGSALSRLPILLLTFAGLALGVFTAVLNIQSSHAASSTSCGRTECYVDSAVRGESDWATEPYTSQTGETVTPGTGGGGGTPKFLTTYTACSSWHSSSTGGLVFTYPHESSGTHRCWFPDLTMTESNTCPPRPDRASNGRVDYYIERVKEDGSKVWVFARFRCLYPTDSNAPIKRLVGQGKVYTGGQASFYQTSTTAKAKVNKKYAGGGTLSNTTGYINRKVNLKQPERYVGAWEPAFQARTLTRNGQPVYGYYRLDWRLDYRNCERWAYPAWLNVPSVYDCSERGTDTSASPYTYACNFTPPLRTGVQTNALFTPSRCAPDWACVIPNDYEVGGEPTRLTVLRNGEGVSVQVPTGSVRGSGVRNARGWKVAHTINPKATPDESYVQTSWAWEKWQTYRRNGTIAFNWASENRSSPFRWSTRYKFVADFYLPVQNGNTWSYKWVTGSGTCSQTLNSPAVSVTRSVNR